MGSHTIGILHPGMMGISVAATLLNGEQRVCWASRGRSPATRERAERHGLRDVDTLAALYASCAVLISVCPPHAAEAVAREAAEAGFQGLYIDANAIAPARARRIGQSLAATGAAFVDGGIIGPPAWEPGQTRLYLAGDEAEAAAALFAAGPLEARVMGADIGQASALKMCFAAYTKGTTALLAAVLAAAEAHDVRPALEEQWELSWPEFAGQTRQRVRRVTAKAWRFAGEMEEIAATFEEAGLPEGFHLSAAALYRRLAHFKAPAEQPPLEAVLAALLAQEAAG